MSKLQMNEFITWAKERGVIFPGSEIYGGLANSWDYGPIGVEMKNNLRNMWWNEFVTKHKNVYGLDSSIILNPKVWMASGHIAGFNDPLVDCKNCKTRFRADKLLEDANFEGDAELVSQNNDEFQMVIEKEKIICPNCGSNEFTNIRNFNLMFETSIGVTQDNKQIAYLRPETAQGIFINFLNVQRTTSAKLPFGIAQVGKAFRNEITPGNFTFRTREFEQMELEFFCHPNDDDKYYEFWKKQSLNFLLEIGIKKDNLKFVDHMGKKLAHYSKATCDLEYNFPFGYSELLGIANRTDFDLIAHSDNEIKKELKYHDLIKNEKYFPHVIEPSIGLDRLLLATMIDSYTKDDERIILKINPKLSAYKVAIMPLTNKLNEQANEVFEMISQEISAVYEASGSIGKRYYKQDAIGTPFCITVDFDTLDDAMVTIRNRNDQSQNRIKIIEILDYIKEKI